MYISLQHQYKTDKEGKIIVDQYTTTIPKDFVKKLGWKKKDILWIDLMRDGIGLVINKEKVNE